MKKFLSALLSIILILSAVPSLASDKYISLDPIVTNTTTGEVKISGKLEGYKYSFWRKKQLATITVIEKGTSPTEAETENEKIFHMVECPVMENGEFTYTFSHNSKKAYDTCVVRVQSEWFGSASGTYSFYYSGTQEGILKDAGAVISGSPLYFAGGAKIEGKRVAYIANGTVYLPSDMAARILAAEYNENEKSFVYNGVKFTGDVSAEELKAAGAQLYEYSEYGIVYFGEEITSEEAESLIPMFGIYVSESGSDYASGTIKDPVRTINKALELYHTTSDNEYIFALDGVYEGVISINESYSNLTIRGLGNAAIRTPSVKLSAESFTKVKDEEVLAKLPPQVANSVLCAPVPGFNETMTDIKYGDYYKVFQNEKEATLARYPNGGGFVTADKIMNTEDPKTETLLYNKPEKIAQWGKEDQIYALSFRECGYNYYDIRLLSTDTTENTLTLDLAKGVNTAQKMGKRFSVYNAICEIDVPGEWYIDREKEMIYYYPLPGFDGLEIISESKDLVTINGAKNIRLEDFEISRSRRNGLTIKNADNIKVINCEVKDIGRSGIKTENITNSTIDGCDVHNVLCEGISLNYAGSSEVDRDLVQQNNIVQNCSVYNIGLKKVIAGAIYVAGTGNTVSHNTVFNVPHMAIWFCGNDNIVEYNECYNCLKYCDDAGVLYGNPGMKGFGNVLRYNYVHNFHTFYKSAGELYVIYLDADTSGTLVQGNIIDIRNKPLNTALALIGGGRNNVVKENILLGSAHNGHTAFYMSNRYSGWVYQPQLIENLGVYKFVQKLTTAQRELWFTKYPGFKDEYGHYEKYVNDIAAGIENTGSALGVARECLVKDNIVVSDWFKTKGYNTYDEKMTACFGEPGTIEKGFRYDKELSTGNTFYLLNEYDPKNAVEKMAAGSKKIKALSKRQLDILYPQNNAVIKTGDTRIVWDREAGAGEYTATVYDDASNVIYQEITIENFIDVSLTEGRYRLELTARNHGGEVVLSDDSEFMCTDSDADIITSLDLFENNTKLSVGDTGTISVCATNSEGLRKSVISDADLKFTSSNEDVLSINNAGVYTAHANGMAVITATYRGISQKAVLFVTDTVYDELTADKLSSYAGASQIVAAENPIGTKQAMMLSSSNEQNISSFASVSNLDSYFLNAWIYDEGINANAPRFGAGTDAGFKVRFGAENEAAETYKLLLNNEEATVSKIVDTKIERTNGWHQVFAEFVYNENESITEGSAEGVTTISFYLDGVLASQINIDEKVNPNLLETGTNTKFLDRYVAKYYKSPIRITEEQKLEAIAKIQNAFPAEAENVFEAQRVFLELDYTDFDALVHKNIIYAMLAEATDFTSSTDYVTFFDKCVLLVKALEENDYNTIDANKAEWGIGSLSVYSNYQSFSAEERKVINDKILERGFESIAEFSNLFKTNMADTLLENTLSAIKDAEAQNNADYTSLYTLLSGKSDVYTVDFLAYSSLSEPKQLRAITLLCKALYDKEVLTEQVIQQELDSIITAIQSEVNVVDIDISDNRTMFSVNASDAMTGQIKVLAFYDNNTKGYITGNSKLTYTSSDNRLVKIYPDGTYKINGSGMAIITVKCETVEKSMVFYATAEAPYRRDYAETETDSIILTATDPVYGAGKAMKISSSSYDKIEEIKTTTSPTQYTAGMWVYDKGVGKNIPYFGIGRYSDRRVQYGAASNAAEKYTLGIKGTNLEGTISEEVQIPREVGWHHIFAKVSYDSTKTTTEFYFDGRYVGKTVTNSFNPPCYLYASKEQEFKERYVAVYYGQNVVPEVEPIEKSYEYTTENNKTKLSVTLKSNIDDEETKVSIIFACKNSQGVVTSVKIYPLKIDPNGEVTESMEAAAGNTIEAFIWDGVSTMTPLFEKIDS